MEKQRTKDKPDARRLLKMAEINTSEEIATPKQLAHLLKEISTHYGHDHALECLKMLHDLPCLRNANVYLVLNTMKKPWSKDQLPDIRDLFVRTESSSSLINAAQKYQTYPNGNESEILQELEKTEIVEAIRIAQEAKQTLAELKEARRATKEQVKSAEVTS